MNITAKQIERSNAVFVFKDGSFASPEPAEMFSLYSAEEAKGSLFSDNPSTATRVFEFPSVGFTWVFEPGKVRLEDKKNRTPDESKLVHELTRMVSKLRPGAIPAAYGYNYDIIYRMDAVIPVGAVMGHFLRPETIESVKDFGWQYSLSKEKGKRLETYFFKAVSPIEYAVHANCHFNIPGMPKESDMAKAFADEYKTVDEAIHHIAFK